ncbi:hypothetical protein RB195_005622 [Necator americanus]|uniref:Las1-like protein n=1 Tax=Necator americanus TaxID=51031 RepID=A0ABR1BRX6_NECAM
MDVARVEGNRSNENVRINAAGLKGFINYVNEICQSQSQRHTSIIKAVQHLGIPTWLVEIRHNASHSHVPPIGTLRKAFHFCRQWLWDNFWSRQPYEAMRSAGVVENHNDMVAAEAELRDLRIRNAIVAYALWRNNNNDDSNNGSGVRPVAELHRFVMQLPYDFLRIFVTDGFLIMTEEQLKSADFTVKEGWNIPLSLQLYWKPVFIMIYEAKVVNELIISLLSRITFSENPLHEENQVVSWTKFFLEPCVQTNNDIITPSDWSRILHKMVAATGYFDAELVESVMAKVPNLTEKRRRQVRRIMDISLSESLRGVDDSMSVRTLEDLQRLIRRDRDNAASANVPSSNKFSLCDPEDWISVPLGLLPGGSTDTLSLILDDDWMAAQKRPRLETIDLSVIEEEE